MSRSAPGLQLDVVPARGDVLERLRRGEVDCCFTAARHATPKGVDVDRLGDDGFVCMVARTHPFARRAPNLERFLRARHALVAPGGERGGYVDDALERIGERRRVSLRLPHFLVMPFAIASSDLVVTLGERIARVYAGHLPVKLFAPPVSLPRFTIAGYWHERASDDPALTWLRTDANAGHRTKTSEGLNRGGQPRIPIFA